MRKAYLLSLLLVVMFLAQPISALPFGTTGDSVDETITDDEAIVEENPEEQVLKRADRDEPYYDLNDLVEIGAATKKVIPMETFNGLEDLYNLNRNSMPLGLMPTRADSWKDENDDYSNATPIDDGDSIENNVTSHIIGNAIYFDDQDYYLVNLTVDGANNTVDRLNITIFSNDSVKESTHLIVECFGIDYLLQQYISVDFQVTGGLFGNTSYIDVLPEGIPNQNIELPYYIKVYSFNDTRINYTLDVDLVPTSRTEWNGFFQAGTYTNKTNLPPRLSSIHSSQDFFDWYDLTPFITESGLDMDRGDNVELSMTVQMATEVRDPQLGYAGPGLWGQQLLTASIMYVYFIYFNYTSLELNIYTAGGALPYASLLFGANTKTVAVGVPAAQISNAYVGVSPLQLWIAGTSGYVGTETDANIKYNITNIITDLIPPNDLPTFNLEIPDFQFEEDTGPLVNATDLNLYFSDLQPEHDVDLMFEVEGAGNNPKQLSVDIAGDGQMTISVTEKHWFGQGEFRIKCFDWGRDWERATGDEVPVYSNWFDIYVTSVNDDAYISKVDLPSGGTQINDHRPVFMSLAQGAALQSKKIYGIDDDDEDQGEIAYMHNSTSTSFTLNTLGQFTFRPTNEDVGHLWVNVTVDDGHLPSPDDFCILHFQITNRNDGPTISQVEWKDKAITREVDEDTTEIVFRNVDEGTLINLTLTASDPDVEIGQIDPLSWLSDNNLWGLSKHPYDLQKAYLTYTPTNDDSLIGEVSTYITVMDAQGEASSDIKITLMVENVNDKPVILTINDEAPVEGEIYLNTENGKNGFEDEPFILTVIAEDIDYRDQLSFSINTPEFQKSMDLYNDFKVNFTIIPPQEMMGDHTLIITVMDKLGAKATVKVLYQIVGTNDPPETPGIRYDDFMQLLIDTPIDFEAIDNGDPDGEELTFKWNFGDLSPLVEGENVNHTYSVQGTYKVTLIAVDGAGAEALKEIHVTIYEAEIEFDPDLDTDGDGIPDIFEERYTFLDRLDPTDAGTDWDGDDFSNLEEYLADTDPLDKNSHPVVISSDDEGLSGILILLIIVVIVVLIGIIALVMLLLRKPKPVGQQMMYGAENQLPPGAYPQGQLPPAPVQTGVLPTYQTQQLPPAPVEEAPKEEDYLAGFMEEAKKELDASREQPEEGNVWVPPEQEEVSHDTVDDLFDDDEPTGEAVSPTSEAAPPQAQPPVPEVPTSPPVPPSE